MKSNNLEKFLEKVQRDEFSIGEALANWTVTLNGQALTEQPVAGSMVVSVVKDATGLWLNVARSGGDDYFQITLLPKGNYPWHHH